MRRLVFVMLIAVTAGCASIQTSEPVTPGVHLHTADVAGAPQATEKAGQPAVSEPSPASAPAVTTGPSRSAAPEEPALQPQASSPSEQHKPERALGQPLTTPVPDHKLQGFVKLAEINDARITNVFVGMYRKNVEDIMGRAQNPY